MSASVVKPAGALTIGAVAGAALLLGVASMISILSVLIGQSGCPGTQAVPSASAEHGIPATYLSLYQRAGREYGIPWHVLAGIGSIESDHGRSHAPGVRSGLNSYGCCAGPMQFNLRDGPPSTWDRYGVDGNRDGTRDVYDPADAIASAANYLRALLRDAGGNLSQAVFGYNHSQAYVNDVLARARDYTGLTDIDLAGPVGDPTVMAGCAGGGIDVPVGPANLRVAERVFSPRAFRALPSWALATGTGPAAVDARLYDDVVWILRRYHLRVTAAREAGPPDARRRHRRRPRPRRRHHPGDLGRVRRTPRPRPRLDPGVRAVRHPPRVPARAGDPVHRLRRLPRPRLAAHLRGQLPRAPAPLLGLALLRHEQPGLAVRVGHGVPHVTVDMIAARLSASGTTRSVAAHVF